MNTLLGILAWFVIVLGTWVLLFLAGSLLGSVLRALLQ